MNSIELWMVCTCRNWLVSHGSPEKPRLTSKKCDKYCQLMSESTLSAWSLSIHVPRGGVGGDPFRSLFDLQYWCTSSQKCIWILIFWPVCIGIHLLKMCTSTKFSMFSFVRGSNPRACTNTFSDELFPRDEKLRKSWKLWTKNPGIHERNHEIHDQPLVVVWACTFPNSKCFKS